MTTAPMLRYYSNIKNEGDNPDDKNMYNQFSQLDVSNDDRLVILILLHIRCVKISEGRNSGMAKRKTHTFAKIPNNEGDMRRIKLNFVWTVPPHNWRDVTNNVGERNPQQ